MPSDPDGKRFNPGQPHISSGQPGGGQWTNGEGGDSGGFGPGGLGGREPSLPDLVGGRGGPLSPEAIRSLYRDFGGHHVAPLADTLRRSDMLTPDAIDVLSSRTIGGGGPLSDQKDASNPHRGRTAEHRAYEQATRELTDKFIADNKIDSKNPITREQANRLADSIEQSKDPRIERFLQTIRRYIDDTRRRGGRFRGGRGGRGE